MKKPVTIITDDDLVEGGGSYKLRGGKAIRVSGENAPASGVGGGVAIPVYVVGANWPGGIAGGQPLRVASGTGRMVAGGVAIPVYPVNDWPDTPAPPEPFVGAYDAIPNIVHHYEIARRGFTAYTGNLVRLRRSSDNAESDFTYDANGDLDTAAITTWLAGADPFVVTVYDQVGSDDVAQATAGNQPSFIASGQNGKPEMDFDGVRYLQVAFSSALSQPYTYYAGAKMDTVAVNDGTYDSICDGDDFTNRIYISQDAGKTPDTWRMIAGTALSSATATDDSYHLFSAQANGVSSELFLDGASIIAGDAGAANADGLTVGSVNTGGNGWKGEIGVFSIADPAHDATQQAAMETAINDYYYTAGAYDAIPNIVHHYEIARLGFYTYTNQPLVLLRRDSDQAEQAFSHDANGDLDVAAITTWAAGANVFVVTVYDQVGSDDVTQATAGNQPAFVASGQNGKPTMRFDGVSDRLAGTFSGTAAQPISVYAAAALDVSDGASSSILVDGGSYLQTLLYSLAGSPNIWRIYAGVGLGSSNDDTNFNIWAALFNGASSAFWLNSSLDSSGNAGASSMTGITMGASRNASFHWGGDIAMVSIADPSHDATEQTAMETAINDYYGAY